jgi:hypothetical protein
VAQANKKWRLSKTQARRLEYRPMEDADIRYAWGAYKQGGLAGFPAELTAEAFKDEFARLIVTRYDAAWTLLAETKKGFIPVGIAAGFWPHTMVTTFLIFNSFTWFPWASPRNKIESAVNFFDKARLELPMIGFANERDKEFMATIAKHGVLRRVGTTMNVIEGQPASVWETRA